MNPIVWRPQSPEISQMWQFMRFIEQQHRLHCPDYQHLHQWSVNHPEQFWGSICDFFKIDWNTPTEQILTRGKRMIDTQWFHGATFNFAEKLLSRTDDTLALISLDESGHREVLTYAELNEAVKQCASGLKQLGIGPSDRVAAILPNSSYAVIAMLATTSLGAIWASCSPDFGTDAALDRLGQIAPKLLFMCDGYTYQGKRHPVLDKMQTLRALMPSLNQVVICPFLNRELDSPPPNTLLWQHLLTPYTHFSFAPFAFNHPIYIMFSSGTTGKPKCIVHSAGGTLLQHVKELGLHTDIQATDNILFYTTCGWMMWNWTVSALALGATLTLYDGAPMWPQPNRLFDIIAQEKVTVFGTSAKFISAVEKAGITPSVVNPESLRCILSTGSPLLPKNYDFVYQSIKPQVQLCSISGGTDILSCFALGNPLLPIYRGELQCIGLGMNVHIFDEQGLEIVEQPGELVCTTPFPSMPVQFWDDPDQAKYLHAYFAKFPGVWAHGDLAEMTAQHGLIIYGRSDAVLNPGGVRIGTAEIYHQVEKVDAVMDSVVIAQPWEDDVRVVLFVKLREGYILDDAIENLIRQTIRINASPKHVPAKILQVPDIPRTINGKIVELAVRDVIEGKPVKNLNSLANPESLAYFKNRPELLG